MLKVDKVILQTTVSRGGKKEGMEIEREEICLPLGQTGGRTRSKVGGKVNKVHGVNVYTFISSLKKGVPSSSAQRLFMASFLG